MSDIFNLANKTAMVIGGTSGIGRMLSIGLAQAIVVDGGFLASGVNQ